MTRRDVLAGGAAAAAAFGAASVGSAEAGGVAAGVARARDPRPNVLFVVIDDLNDWTGWQGGYPGVKTPNLDRLARLATGFRRAYTPAPACNPARASILFGAQPFKSGIYTNNSADWTETGLADKRSIVRWFRDAGYRTIGTGKVYHGGWRHETEGPERNDPAAWTDFHYLSDLVESGKGQINWGPRGATPDTEDVGRATFLADKVLSKTHDRPFFAALGIRKPHMPWFAPQEWFDEYPVDDLVYPPGALDVEHATIPTNKDDVDLPTAGRAMVRQKVADHRKILAGPGWKSAVQAYLASIALSDHALGVVLDGLLQGPNASNTIVCVWSDNGWQLGEKLAWHKFTLWERATRVPVLIGGAGLRGGPSDALISTIDLYPTLVELAGGEPQRRLDGVSFAPYLRGRADEPRDHVLATWSLDVDGDRDGDGDRRRNRHFAVRSRTHRLIAYGNGDRELYDHRSDPWEWRNLLAQNERRSSGSSESAVAENLERFVPQSSVPEVRAAREGED